MRVVVTGARGLTGGAVARALVARGDHVIAVSRRPSGVAGAIEVIGDCLDSAVMSPALADADALVHVAGILYGPRLAALPGIRSIGRVVVISSAGIYSRHRASAAAYRDGERAIAVAQPRALFVRPTMIYGSARDRNIHYVVTFARRFGFLPQIGPATTRVQPIHYEDLARAVATLVPRTEIGTIDAGGGAPISLSDLLRAVLVAVGRSTRLVRLPAGPAMVAASAIDRLRGSRWAERVARMSEDRTVDITPLVDATGVRPRVFESGIRDQIAAMRGERVLPR